MIKNNPQHGDGNEIKAIGAVVITCLIKDNPQYGDGNIVTNSMFLIIKSSR